MIEAPHLSSSLLITNDIVRIVSDKEFHWLGRYDNIINTGGIKVSAEEIERKLQSYIKEPFFIAGIADQTFGQAVSIIIESSNFDKNSLDKYIALLDKYERPKHILTIDKFSYTENGKINKPETIKRLTQS
jgi:O-succinylbenzoic acid--CoA ligase